MDLTKYEKIDAVQALVILKRKQSVFSKSGWEYNINPTNKICYISNNGANESEMSFNEFIKKDWYIKKPFDVREAMRERPDEWVGAYVRHGRWYKVAFDSRYFRAIETRIHKEIEVDFTNADCSYVDPDALDKCIPIEDAPEEARG